MNHPAPDDSVFGSCEETTTLRAKSEHERHFRIKTNMPLIAESVILHPCLPRIGSTFLFDNSPLSPLPLTSFWAVPVPGSDDRLWAVTAKYGEQKPIETTTQANKKFRTFSPMSVPVDISIGNTTIKGEGCCLVMTVGDQPIYSRRIVIVLELDKPPSIEVEYIEK